MQEINYGKIDINLGDEVIYEVDILAKNGVEKKGIWDYMKELFSNLGKVYFETN